MTDAIKRYDIQVPTGGFSSTTVQYVLASDHEREVAGLRAEIEAIKRLYEAEHCEGARLKADRAALQKRCGELEKALDDVALASIPQGMSAALYAEVTLRRLRPAEGEGGKGSDS